MIQNLFDHQAEIYKESKTKGRLKDTTATGYILSGSEKCAIVPFKESRRNSGAGEEITGTMQSFFRFGSNISENDVIKVVSGPESPSKWRVLSVIHPRSHHAEVTLERDETINV